MTNSQKIRVVPAVGAALIAAGGVLWVVQQLPPSSTEKEYDNDRVVSLEATSTSTAVATMIVQTNLRGEIFNDTSSLSQVYRREVWVRAEELVTAVVVVSQDAPKKRQRASCLIKLDGLSFPNEIIVRTGNEKTVTCRGSN
jgi:hypothetical protein